MQFWVNGFFLLNFLFALNLRKKIITHVQFLTQESAWKHFLEFSVSCIFHKFSWKAFFFSYSFCFLVVAKPGKFSVFDSSFYAKQENKFRKMKRWGKNVHTGSCLLSAGEKEGKKKFSYAPFTGKCLLFLFNVAQMRVFLQF